jgi:hypothetical protein
LATLQDKIQWHPGFCGAAELELRENKADLEFEREYHLSKEPIRIDLLIIKKHTDAQIKNEFGRIFKKFNVLEYKNPSDNMSIDDYFKAVGYACLYKGLGETVNAVPAEELTVSLVREIYPREMIEKLKALGATIEQRFPGIYYVHGMVLFDTQIVVTSELTKKLHSSLRVLSKKADKDDVRNFLQEIEYFHEPGDKNNADAVLEVSVAANHDVYEMIKEELTMGKALRALMKDEFEAELAKQLDVEVAKKVDIEVAKCKSEIRAEGKSEGKSEGKAEQAMTTAYSLADMGMSTDKIAQAIHYNVDTVIYWLETRTDK